MIAQPLWLTQAIRLGIFEQQVCKVVFRTTSTSEATWHSILVEKYKYEVRQAWEPLDRGEGSRDGKTELAFPGRQMPAG